MREVLADPRGSIPPDAPLCMHPLYIRFTADRNGPVPAQVASRPLLMHRGFDSSGVARREHINAVQLECVLQRVAIHDAVTLGSRPGVVVTAGRLPCRGMRHHAGTNRVQIDTRTTSAFWPADDCWHRNEVGCTRGLTCLWGHASKRREQPG